MVSETGRITPGMTTRVVSQPRTNASSVAHRHRVSSCITAFIVVSTLRWRVPPSGDFTQLTEVILEPIRRLPQAFFYVREECGTGRFLRISRCRGKPWCDGSNQPGPREDVPFSSVRRKIPMDPPSLSTHSDPENPVAIGHCSRFPMTISET